MPLPSLQRSRATPSHDPATASFKNDQTLNLNSTMLPCLDLAYAINFPASLGRTPNKEYCYIKGDITLPCDSLSITVDSPEFCGGLVIRWCGGVVVWL